MEKVKAATEAAIASDAGLAAWVAERAGDLLLQLRRSEAASDAASLRDAGDRQSHELILELLQQHRPADAVLSEEGVDDTRRLEAERVWIVDPLDGTREYGELDRSDWAVHVALVTDGIPVVGAVALPALGEVICSEPAPPLPRRATEQIRLVVSRSHTPPEAGALIERLNAGVVYMGSAGAKTMAVVKGEADAYVHLGGQYEWDSAAPIAVATASGLWTSRADGSPLRYNRRDAWLPDQVVCHPEVRERVLDAVAAVVEERGSLANAPRHR